MSQQKPARTNPSHSTARRAPSAHPGSAAGGNTTTPKTSTPGLAIRQNSSANTPARHPTSAPSVRQNSDTGANIAPPQASQAKPFCMLMNDITDPDNHAFFKVWEPLSKEKHKAWDFWYIAEPRVFDPRYFTPEKDSVKITSLLKNPNYKFGWAPKKVKEGEKAVMEKRWSPVQITLRGSVTENDIRTNNLDPEGQKLVSTLKLRPGGSIGIHSSLY